MQWSIDLGALLVGIGMIMLTVISIWQSSKRAAEAQTDKLLTSIEANRVTMTAMMESHRKTSEEGRARIYERLDSFTHEVRATFLPREIYQADMTAIHHTQEEHAALYADLSRRLDLKCAAVRKQKAESLLGECT